MYEFENDAYLTIADILYDELKNEMETEEIKDCDRAETLAQFIKDALERMMDEVLEEYIEDEGIGETEL